MFVRLPVSEIEIFMILIDSTPKTNQNSFVFRPNGIIFDEFLFSNVSENLKAIACTTYCMPRISLRIRIFMPHTSTIDILPKI